MRLARPRAHVITNARGPADARRGGGGSYPSNTPSSKISGSIEALDAATGAHIGWLTGGFVLLETHDPISFHFRYTKDVSGPTTLSVCALSFCFARCAGTKNRFLVCEWWY